MPQNTRVAPATTPHPSAPAPPERRLYAVAIEVLHRPSGTWRPEIRCTHAVDRPAAKFEVLRGFNWSREFVRVVEVSIVIGYKAEVDKKDRILSVSV